MSEQLPVIVIGIDAATWQVIDPLLAEGCMPNLQYLIHQGTAGALRSRTDYTSPALWTSISTGKVPEKHGVLDFYSATRHHLRCLTVYEILQGKAGRIGLFRWFVTWPPLQNAGFTLPSPIARSRDTYPPGLRFINDLTRPSGLATYLAASWRLLQHGVRLPTLVAAAGELAYEFVCRPEEREWWYRRRIVEAAIHGDVFAYLLRKRQPQFAAILFTLTDDLSHRYWKYREPERFSDVPAEEVRNFGRVIDAAYIAVDRALGVIMGAIPDDALVAVVSDHGQGAGRPLRTPHIMSENVLKLLGFRDRVWMTNIGYRSYLRARSADSSTAVLGEVREALDSIRLQEDGQPVFLASAEDEGGRLVVRVGVDATTALEATISLPGARQGTLGEVAFSYGEISGHHNEWGILILKGPGVKRGHRVEGASILDVTPTLLALRGRPVGRDMDGSVVVDAIEEGFLRENPLRYVASYETEAPGDEDLPFSEEELEDLEARLRSLGYLA